MADQQGKKTQTGQPMNIGGGSPTGGPGSSTGSNTGSTSPSSGQDRAQTTGIKAATAPNEPIKKAQGLGDRSVESQGIKTSAPIANDQSSSEKLSSTANDILDKAKETASGTYNAVSTKATEKIEERKGELSTGLKTLADTVRKTGSDLESSAQTTPLTDAAARYTDTAARQIENVANYFERKDLKAMMRDAENFARRNPAIFLGAAFGLGILAARFLKSSSPDRRSSMQGTAIPSALPSSTRTETGIPRTNP
jgi:ElaB/YqjD/DUF883 family membrane-anchored ribosome-binding protein